ncbi:hypothetical protein MJ904_18265 [Massilia sp. MB5]|uniref:hypothetical protein n=1 Tax=Massilia sp. MB5 TaxID=2919578 RepID=UPI001F117076|nr:hypothetical protein [Massilia sp. MB5]UMR29029.1 hypothetical protein MJ904_18265 [Massilia sp. MB5]
MTTQESGKPNPDAQRLEDFIFARELNEVFLLLDHISGRWDKSWYAPPMAASDEHMPKVRELCTIGLAADGSSESKVDQAVKLLCAKDKLNAAARPATGMTIAFTLLVVGEENRRSWAGWLNGMSNLWQRWTRPRGTADRLLAGDGGSAPPPAEAAKSAGPADATSFESVATGTGTAGRALMPLQARRSNNGYWDKPTRLTLARHAFPGLVSVAAKFKRRIFLIVSLLLLGLATTCVISWHITGGNVILQHLEALKIQDAGLQKTIAEAELKFASDEQERQNGAAAPAATPTATQTQAEAQGQAKVRAAARPVQFCSLFAPDATPLYRSTEEYQLCSRKRELDQRIAIAHDALGNWLRPWVDLYQQVSGWFSGGQAFYPAALAQSNTEELAQIVTMVVGTAVLPLFYGVLGAGAAVVRDLWAKMRESLLSPRDYSLALLQLALGATIGACIALFISPSSQANGKEAGLLGSWALSSSALSFIAGFGVEGVFLALESLVRRVFNISDPAKKT